MAATSETWQQDDHRGVIFQFLHSTEDFIASIVLQLIVHWLAGIALEHSAARQPQPSHMCVANQASALPASVQCEHAPPELGERLQNPLGLRGWSVNSACLITCAVLRALPTCLAWRQLMVVEGDCAAVRGLHEASLILHIGGLSGLGSENGLYMSVPPGNKVHQHGSTVCYTHRREPL